MFWWFLIGVVNWEQKSQETGWICSQWGNEIASIIENKKIDQQDEFTNLMISMQSFIIKWLGVTSSIYNCLFF